jgi:nucleoside-triphosphatase THEP1
MRYEKAQALIIYGPIGSGKTSKAKELTDIARVKGYTVDGVLSLRVIKDDETIGYDGLDLKTGTSFDLVRLRSLATSEDWESIGRWKYSFSREGFKKANEILFRAASESSKNKIIIADEFGHIELLGLGIYKGVKETISSIKKGFKIVVICRTDNTENVCEMLPKNIKVIKISAQHPSFWDKITDCFI